jgi:sporulation protein YlmC with PRC-barrel domain
MESKYLSRDKIVGKQVIDSNGVIMGTIKEIAFDLPGGKMSITVTDEKGKDTEITSDDISALGDVMLLKAPQMSVTIEAPQKPSTLTKAAPAPSATSSGPCPNCGYQNETESRFCIKCGTKLK